MAITAQMCHSPALPPMSTANQLSGTPTTLVPTAKPLTRPRPGLLLEDRTDQGALACLEYVRIPQRDPEALQTCGRLLAVVEFLARPPPLSRLMDLKVEHVPMLDLVAIRGDVVDGLSELSRDTDLAKASFLACFAQGSVLGGFSVTHASSRDLDADMLRVVVGVAEDQELVVADDVAQHFAGVDLARHSSPSWFDRRASTSLEGCGVNVSDQLIRSSEHSQASP